LARGNYVISEVIPMSEEKAIGGIKSTNEFHPPKRERKKKSDTTPVTQEEAELDLQQIGEEMAHKPVGAPAPKPEKANDPNSQGKRPVLRK
jgi:hypothetical protein